jgi:hypothetical protein
MYRNLLLALILFALYVPSVQGQQKIVQRKSSANVFIYQLNSTEVKKMYSRKNFTFKAEYFHTKVDSFFFNQNNRLFKQKLGKLRNGYYVIVRTSYNQVKYSLFTKADLSPQVFNSQKEHHVAIYQKGNTERLSTAKLYVQNSALPYRKATQSYLLPKSSKKKALMIVHQSDTVYYWLDLAKESKSKYNAAGKYNGFIAFNKPKYLPNDTLKLKALVLKKSGKPYTKDAMMRLKIRYGKTILFDTLKNDGKGTFKFEMVLSDSLTIDSRYEVTLYDKYHERSYKAKRLVTEEFYLEDYQLDEAFFDVTTSQHRYESGDTVSIKLSGKDVNGLPLMNVSYEVRVQPSSVTKISGNEAFIPAIVHEDSGKLNNKGKHQIQINSALLPKASIRYNVWVKYISNNFELQEKRTYFRINIAQDQIAIKSSKDSLMASLIANDKSISGSGQVLTVFKNSDTLRQNISYPAQLKMHPNAIKYTFTSGQLTKKFYSPFEDIQFEHLRTKDSLHINAVSHRNIPLHFVLHKDGKEFKKGTATQLVFNIADGSKSQYEITYQYIWKGENFTQDFTIKHAEDQLQVELEQPERIFPGETAKIKVKVSDYWGKPVKDANITSSSVNNLFTESNLPSAPSFQKTEQPKIKAFGTTQLSISLSDKLTERWLADFNLDTVHYYQLIYAAKSFYQKYVKTSTNNAQFWPFVMNDTEPEFVYGIYIDDVPHYYNDSRSSSYPRSVAAKMGYHTVRVKTYKHEITIDSVLFKTGHKLELSVDIKTKHRNVTIKKTGKKPSKEDEELLLNSFISISDLQWFSKGFIRQDSIVYKIRSSSYQKIGPLIPNRPVQLYSDKYDIEFEFDPSKVYEISSREITMADRKEYIASASKYVKDLYSFELGKRRSSPNYNLGTGELVYSINDIDNLRPAEHGGRAPSTMAINVTERGKGVLTVETLGDSVVHLIKILGHNGEGGSILKPQYIGQNRDKKRIYKGEFYNLIPGIYRVEFVTASNYSFAIDSIQIKPNFLTYKKLESKPYKAMPFSNTSTEKLTFNYPKKNKDFSGTIYQNDRKTYAGNSKVILCKGYRKIETVTTSSIGRFTFKNIPSGIYNLWIQHPNEEKVAIIGIPIKEGAAPNITVYLKNKKKLYSKTKYKNIYTESYYYLFSDTLIVYEPYKHKDIFLKKRLAALSETNLVRPQFDSNLYGDHEEEGYQYKSNYHSNKTNYHYNNDKLYLNGKPSYHRGFSLRRLFGLRRKNSFYRQSYSWLASNKKRKVRAKFGGGNSSPRAKGDSRFDYSSNYEDDNERSVLAVVLDGDDEAGNVSFGNNSFENGTPGKSDSLDLLDPTVKSIRGNFSDYAYWQPTLYTNENGEVEFEVTFPDNITEWKSYAMAVAGTSNGLAQQLSQAFKDVMGKLILPRFLVIGDQVEIKGEASNHTSKTYNATSKFSVNGNVVDQKDTTLQKFFNHNYQLTASNSDSLKVMFELGLENGYKDAELRDLPIVPLGIEIAEGDFLHLDKDTTLNLDLEPNAEYTLFAADNPLDLLLERIEEIKNYPYYCNEQIASKLMALLMEKQIDEARGKKFNNGYRIRNLISKLKKNQLVDGDWGWWSSSRPNLDMTIYISKILTTADKAGYNVDFNQRTLERLKRRVTYLAGWQLLNTLDLFSELGDTNVSYKENLLRLKNRNMQTYGQLLITRIKQQQQLDYNVEALLKQKKTTMFGSSYWGEHNFSWYDNSTQSTLLAYKILRDDSRINELSKIRSFFLEPNNENTWRNTYETASVLTTILPDLLEDVDKTYEKPQLHLSKAVQKTVTSFPMKLKLDPGSKALTVNKTGKTPVFFTAYKHEWIVPEKKYTEYFDIKTYFDQDSIASTIKLEAGENTVLMAEVTVKKKADYVMIEIPIPAGCTFNSKDKSNSIESHRESHKNKVAIFCEAMKPGKYKFKIDLQSRFKGQFQLNAAKAELMYFPTFKGYNTVKKVEVK